MSEVQIFERYDLATVLASIGSIFAGLSAFSGVIVGFLVDAYADRSMIEKLYSVEK